MNLDGNSKQDLWDGRKKYFARSVGLSFQSPLEIVRGEGPYVFDETGKAYLDSANNVAHVGHCHPHVVQAGQKQMEILNTNTRYLNQNRLRYLKQLKAKFPDPLSVFFFVNSGSEANDLALRLMRAHTGSRNLICVDGAYHGNLSSLIEISSYKYKRSKNAHAAAKGTFAYEVGLSDSFPAIEKAIRDLGVLSENLGGFICEPVLSCGGQITPPPSYLKEVYRLVRAAGGVCISDEVQVGFGRLGSHFWGFELHDVVPDIVTLGKPMGNGHPMAAVVTTREIANSFDKVGLEYFNTYGGNPVSCAIGSAVLEVIENENLQKHALDVGNYFKQAVGALKEKSSFITDVRGTGLFLGIELQNPALATHLSEAMKEDGIIISVDGPLNNVLKIKPPLVFSTKDADKYVESLRSNMLDFSSV